MVGDSAELTTHVADNQTTFSHVQEAMTKLADRLIEAEAKITDLNMRAETVTTHGDEMVERMKDLAVRVTNLEKLENVVEACAG